MTKTEIPMRFLRTREYLRSKDKDPDHVLVDAVLAQEVEHLLMRLEAIDRLTKLRKLLLGDPQ